MISPSPTCNCTNVIITVCYFPLQHVYVHVYALYYEYSVYNSDNTIVTVTVPYSSSINVSNNNTTTVCNSNSQLLLHTVVVLLYFSVPSFLWPVGPSL